MSENREFFITQFKAEQPTFLSVFRALPADRIDYRPHERSNSAGDIVWSLAEEQAALIDLLDSGEIQWKPRPKPTALTEMIADYERSTADVGRRLQKMTDDRWKAPGQFVTGGKVVFAARIQDLAWWILFDGIHHRGQLTTYIRPMGGKVPAVYGPSADTA